MGSFEVVEIDLVEDVVVVRVENVVVGGCHSGGIKVARRHKVGGNDGGPGKRGRWCTNRPKL